MKVIVARTIGLCMLLLIECGQNLVFAAPQNPTYEQAKKAVATGKQSSATKINSNAGVSQQGQPPKAVTELDAQKEAERVRKEVAEKSEKPEVYVERGLVFDGLKEYKNAIANYDFAIYLNPKLWQAYYQRAADKHRLDDFDAALKDLAQAIAINPKYADSYYLRGLVLNDMGEYIGAIVEFDKAASMSVALKGKAQTGSGVANYYLNQYDIAKKNFEAAIVDEPSESTNYVWLGRIYTEKRNYTEALNTYDKAISINPKDSLAYLFKGRTLAFFMKDYDEGIAAFTKAIELSPDDADNYLQRAYAYNQNGNGELAKADFDKAVSLDPKLKEQVLPAYRGDAKVEDKKVKHDPKKVVTVNG